MHIKAYPLSHTHTVQAQGKQQELMKPLAEHVPARPTHTHTYTHSHTHMHSHMLMLMHTSAHRHRVGSRS